MESARCASSFHAGIWMMSFNFVYPVQNYHRAFLDCDGGRLAQCLTQAFVNRRIQAGTTAGDDWVSLLKVRRD